MNLLLLSVLLSAAPDQAPEPPQAPDLPAQVVTVKKTCCLECGPSCECEQCGCDIAAQKQVRQKAAPCFHCGQGCDCINCGCDAYYNKKIQQPTMSQPAAVSTPVFTGTPRSAFSTPTYTAPAPRVQIPQAPQPIYLPVAQPVRQPQPRPQPVERPVQPAYLQQSQWRPTPQPTYQRQPAYYPPQRQAYYASPACSPGRG